MYYTKQCTKLTKNTPYWKWINSSAIFKFQSNREKKRSSLLTVALSPLNPWIKKCIWRFELHSQKSKNVEINVWAEQLPACAIGRSFFSTKRCHQDIDKLLLFLANETESSLDSQSSYQTYSFIDHKVEHYPCAMASWDDV